MNRTILYRILAIVGFIAPNILVLVESLDTGNILLYTDLVATFNAMFANRISSIFAIDLLFAVLVFFIWIFGEKDKLSRGRITTVCLLTLLLGLAGGFPLYLYYRELSAEH